MADLLGEEEEEEGRHVEWTLEEGVVQVVDDRDEVTDLAADDEEEECLWVELRSPLGEALQGLCRSVSPRQKRG